MIYDIKIENEKLLGEKDMKKTKKRTKILPIACIFAFFMPICIPSNAIAHLSDRSMSELLPGIDTLRAKAPENNGYWGFILSTNFRLFYGEGGDGVNWSGGPFVDCIVIGIGKHFIHYTCNYSIYNYNSTQPYNGSFNGSDDLYLFNLHQKPIIKIKASTGGGIITNLFKKGTWVGKLYIDGTLIETKEGSYEHH